MENRSPESWIHPCLRCGACCAYFRVSFYWREAEPIDHDHPVPANYFIEQNDRYRCMKGTDRKRGNRCVALQGEVGVSVACEIYANRPNVCRDFEASFETGTKNIRCDKARAKHGLRPLDRSDWIGAPSPQPSLPSHDVEVPA